MSPPSATSVRRWRKFDAGDRLVPIRVQLEDAARGDLQTLQELRVPLGEHGEKGGVPLSVVADIKLDQGPTSINRYDRERQATVAADLVGSAALGDVHQEDLRAAGHEKPAEGRQGRDHRATPKPWPICRPASPPR